MWRGTFFFISGSHVVYGLYGLVISQTVFESIQMCKYRNGGFKNPFMPDMSMRNVGNLGGTSGFEDPSIR